MHPARRTDPLWSIDEQGRLVFEPSSTPQRQFIESPANEILFSGHQGNGKSIALCTKIVMLANLYPGIKGVLGRRFYADLRISTLPHLRRVIGDGAYFAGLTGGQRPESFRFPNGSELLFIGMRGETSQTSKLLSTEFGFAAFDECNELDESDWELALGRLRQPTVPIGQIFGSCNPDHPQHWLFHRFHPDRGTNLQRFEHPCDICRGTGVDVRWFEDEATGQLIKGEGPCERCRGAGTVEFTRQCVVAGPRDNERNLPSWYLAQKRQLRGVRAQRWREGKWVAFEGSVYDNFDPSVHVRPRPREWVEQWGGYPPPSWPRFMSVDFGYSNAFVCQWFARDPDGAFWLYREIYKTRTIVSDHAKRMLELERHERDTIASLWWKREQAKYDRWEWDRIKGTLAAPAPTMHGRYADHDAEDRATLRDAGVITTPAWKEKKPGIEAVYKALQPIEVGPDQWRAGLYLIEDALAHEPDEMLMAPPRRPTCTLEEIAGYRWLPAKEGRSAKEDTVDENDHGMDALRYGVGTAQRKSSGRIFGLSE